MPPQITSQGRVPIFRYALTSFALAGVDNNTQAPGQDPEMWEQLTNVMPITKGVLERRWGYSLWANPGTAAAQLVDYQSDETGQRNVLYTTESGSTPVKAYNDDGSIFNGSIFQPTAGLLTRAVTSRSYAYFTNGTDYKKWNGKATSTATKWGINVNDATVAASGSSGPRNSTAASDLGTSGGSMGTSQGPNVVTSGADGGGADSIWSNPGNVTSGTYLTTASANIDLDTTTGSSNYLLATGFGFSIPSTAVSIDGISVTASRYAGGASPVVDGSIKIIKGGVVSGNEQALAFTDWASAPGEQITYGNASDTWGVSWSYSDINASNFGVALSASALTSGTAVAHYFYVTITVYYTIPTSTFSWTSPTNVEGNSAYATATASTGGTSRIRTNTYGFPSLGSVTIVGIQVNVTCSAVGGTNPTLQLALDKSSTQYTSLTGKAMPSSAGVLTFGGATDLWGGVWSPSDLTPAGFGVEFYCQTTSGSSSVSVKNITITVYYAQSAFTLTPGAGSITLNVGRNYTVCFYNSNTSHYSDIYNFSVSTGPLSSQNVAITNIPVSNDTQTTHTILLATADGGDETRLYFLAQLAASATSYTDSTTESALLANPVYLSTDSDGNEFGVTGNDPPPTGTILPTKHRGRLYLIKGSTLYWSKSIGDVTTDTGFIAGRWEECWPPENQTDISESAETPAALLSDGLNLYIGTEFRIRRVNGDIGSNGLEPPDIVHNEVGALNQDVLKIVFAEGVPAGGMWLTPDNRMILSDFNTYTDVGTPIQATLNTINTATAVKTACASFFSQGAYDLYLLAIPTGLSSVNDTLCVFNMRTKRWVVWQLSDNVASLLFHVQASGASQLVFGSSTGKIYALTPNSTQDRIGDTPVTYSVTARTSWLALGDASKRKLLNEIEVFTNDSTLTLTTEGASRTDQFLNPETVSSSSTVVLSVLGTYKVFLAGLPAKDRYYRFTFTSSNANASTVVGGYIIRALVR